MFVVCGEAVFDLFGEETGGGLSYTAVPGGSPFNIAVGLARLGQPASLLAGLSTDALGERLARVLVREGVGTALLHRTTRPTTLSLVDLGPDGQPRYAFYGEGAADRALTCADLPELGRDVWGIHAGSYVLVVEPIASALLTLFRREAGRRILTLDLNTRLKIEPDAGLWRRRIAEFAALSDIVKASDEDIGLLQPGVEPAEFAEGWLAEGAALAIVTKGAAGAEVFSAHGRHSLPAPAVSVCDTVGAGDSFQAALIAGLAEQGIRSREALDTLSAQRLKDTVARAIEAAAITCTRRGADLPRRAELPALTEEAL